MSRIYFTATMPHAKFGLALPTLSFETNDHTGGGYDIGGLHPTSIAALFGKGPEIKKGERFDLKFNLNAKRYIVPPRPIAYYVWSGKLTQRRTAFALVVNTTKHLPHWEWSSDGGAGKFLAVGFLLSRTTTPPLTRKKTGKLPLAALAALGTQIFKSGEGTKDGKGGKGSKKDGHLDTILAPKSPIYKPDGNVHREPLKKKRRPSDKSSGRSSRGGYSSSSSSAAHLHPSSRNAPRRHSKRQEPRAISPASPRHAHRRSREVDSSYHSDHPRDSVARRAGSYRSDRNLDSGYASAEESFDDDDYQSRNMSRRESGRKTTRGRKERS